MTILLPGDAGADRVDAEDNSIDEGSKVWLLMNAVLLREALRGMSPTQEMTQ
jgi:hypothetical protein